MTMLVLRVLSIALITCILSFTWEPTATACMCSDNLALLNSPSTNVWPQGHDIPVTTSIWLNVPISDARNILIEGPRGKAVSGSLHPASGWVRFEPDDLLEPGVVYKVKFLAPMLLGAQHTKRPLQRLLVEFRTAEDAIPRSADSWLSEITMTFHGSFRPMGFVCLTGNPIVRLRSKRTRPPVLLAAWIGEGSTERPPDTYLIPRNNTYTIGQPSTCAGGWSISTKAHSLVVTIARVSPSGALGSKRTKHANDGSFYVDRGWNGAAAHQP